VRITVARIKEKGLSENEQRVETAKKDARQEESVGYIEIMMLKLKFLNKIMRISFSLTEV
jgi:hypothetical protein